MRLVASDSVLIPIQCEFFALEGISQLMDTVDRIRDSFQHNLAIEGILLTMYDDRTNLTRQVAADLAEFFEEKSLRPLFREAFGWPKRRAMESRSCLMTSAPKAPKAISNSRKKYWKMTKGTRSTKALGKGLSALLPSDGPKPSAPPEPQPPEPSAESRQFSCRSMRSIPIRCNRGRSSSRSTQ